MVHSPCTRVQRTKMHSTQGRSYSWPQLFTPLCICKPCQVIFNSSHERQSPFYHPWNFGWTAWIALDYRMGMEMTGVGCESKLRKSSMFLSAYLHLRHLHENIPGSPVRPRETRSTWHRPRLLCSLESPGWAQKDQQSSTVNKGSSHGLRDLWLHKRWLTDTPTKTSIIWCGRYLPNCVAWATSCPHLKEERSLIPCKPLRCVTHRAKGLTCISFIFWFSHDPITRHSYTPCIRQEIEAPTSKQSSWVYKDGKWQSLDF